MTGIRSAIIGPCSDIEEAARRGLLCTRASVLSALDRELELAERLTVSRYQVLLWLARATPAGCV
jgi:hypothetical protein